MTIARSAAAVEPDAFRARTKVIAAPSDNIPTVRSASERRLYPPAHCASPESVSVRIQPGSLKSRNGSSPL